MDDLVQPTCQARLDASSWHHRDDLVHPVTDHRDHVWIRTDSGHTPKDLMEGGDSLWHQSVRQPALHTNPVRHAQPAPGHHRHSDRLEFDRVDDVDHLAPLPLGDLCTDPVSDLGIHRDHAADEHHGDELGEIAKAVIQNPNSFRTYFSRL